MEFLILALDMHPMLWGSEEATTALAASQNPNGAASLWRADAAPGDTEEQRMNSQSFLNDNEKQELNKGEKIPLTGTVCRWDRPGSVRNVHGFVTVLRGFWVKCSFYSKTWAQIQKN